VSYDVFRDWAVLHNDALSITRWLLKKSVLSLSSDFDAPTFYQTLAGVTHCMISALYHFCLSFSVSFHASFADSLTFFTFLTSNIIIIILFYFCFC